MTPKISVIIPTFNRQEYILRAVESVMNQTFQDFELIIIDDGSIDNTQKLIEDYIQSNNIKNKIIYEKIENSGVSAARNFGLRMAKGEWIAFLDSDDEWIDKKLEFQNDFIINNPELKIVHGEEIWIRNGVRVNQKKIHQKFGGKIFQKCLALCLISPSAVMISKDVLNENRGFDEDYVVCEDYDLWLKITSKYEVGFISTPIIKKYGGHEDQLSSKFFAMDYWRIKSMDRILNIRVLSDDDIISTKKQIIKKGKILLKGYLKHNNMSNYNEIKSIIENHLKDIEL